MRNIGVLGTGEVGRTLAAGLAGAGHRVMIGTRDPSRDSLLAWQRDEGATVPIGTFDEAAAFGDKLIVAV